MWGWEQLPEEAIENAGLVWASRLTILQVPELLGTTQNELGIREWLEGQGHTLVTTSDKEGENSKFDQELVDAEVIITTP